MTQQNKIDPVEIVVSRIDNQHVFYQQWGVKYKVAEFECTIETYQEVWHDKVQPLLDTNPQLTVDLFTVQKKHPLHEDEHKVILERGRKERDER